jgi:hypothetical protein
VIQTRGVCKKVGLLGEPENMTFRAEFFLAGYICYIVLFLFVSKISLNFERKMIYIYIHIYIYIYIYIYI